MNAKGIIWMLHRVAPFDEKFIFGLDNSLRISPDFLESLIVRSLEKGYKFISIDEFLQKKKSKRCLKRNIVITIDDGFRDIYQYAFPIFKKYNIPFIFYVSSDFIEQGFDGCLLPEADGMMVLMDTIVKNERVGDVVCSTVAEKQQAFWNLWGQYNQKKLQFCGESGRRILGEVLQNQKIDFNMYFRQNICSPKELKEMADDDLCTIGSHAVSHQWLTQIKDKEVLNNEFLVSKEKIEKWIGKEVKHFSYPYGQNDKICRELAKKYYDSAVSILPIHGQRRFVKYSDSDFCLPRISIQENASFPVFWGEGYFVKNISLFKHFNVVILNELKKLISVFIR